MFGLALLMGSGEKEAAKQTSCSLFQADGAEAWRKRRGRKMERTQK